MPSEDEFESFYEKLPDKISAIGDEIKGDLTSHRHMSVGGEDAIGYWCLHGQEEYVIYTKPDQEFYKIIYFGSIIPGLARSLDDELIEDLLEDYSDDELESMFERPDVKEIAPAEVQQYMHGDLEESFDGGDIEDATDLPEKVREEFIGAKELLAAKELIQSVDPGRMEAIKDQLRSELSDPRVAFGLMLENDAVEGFHVTRQVFPYEDGFGLQELSDSVQAIISIGVAGHNTMADGFNEIMFERLGDV